MGGDRMTAGRPTVYSPKMITKARNYIAGHLDFDDPVPTVAGLACVLGVVRDTCYQWAKDKDKPEFSDILKELAQKQERVLVANGLLGGFSGPITKMMLTKHGYSDRVDTDVTTNGKDLPPSIDLSKAPPEVLEWIVAQNDATEKE